jgi:hypothetical protein
MAGLVIHQVTLFEAVYHFGTASGLGEDFLELSFFPRSQVQLGNEGRGHEGNGLGIFS